MADGPRCVGVNECPHVQQKCAEMEALRAQMSGGLVVMVDPKGLLGTAAAASGRMRKGKAVDPHITQVKASIRREAKEEQDRRLDQQRKDQSARIDKLMDRFDGLERVVTDQKEMIGELKTEIVVLKEKVTCLEVENVGLKAVNIGLQEKITGLELESTDLKGRIDKLEDRERQLAMRSAVGISKQFSELPDPETKIYWSAYPPRETSRLLKLTDDIRVHFKRLMYKGNLIAHDIVTQDTLKEILASPASSDPERMIAEDLLRYMMEGKIDYFKSSPRPKKPKPVGTPPKQD